MAIGDIRVPRSQQRTSSVQTNADQFGAGVGRATANLARGVEDLGTGIGNIIGALDARNKKAEDFDTQKRFIQEKGQRDRRQAEVIREARENGTHVGVTNRVNEEIEQVNRAFLETVPPRLREQYALQLEQDLNNKVNGAFAFEYDQGNEQFVADAGTALSDLSNQMMEGSISGDSALEEYNALIDSSDLPAIQRQSMKQAGIDQIRTTQFQQEMAIAARSTAPVGVADGSQPVAAGLTPGRVNMLNTISTDESGDRYNVRYDGSASGATFDSFADHPRVFVETETGELSSAAGRYMITATTWDRVAGILGLTSFSPENQDRAALYLAEERWNRVRGNGPSFDAVLSSGDPALMLQLKNSLDKEWVAFQGMSDEKFLQLMSAPSNGTGSASNPDVWSDPRYDGMSYEQKLKLSEAATAEEKARQAQIKKAQDGALEAQLNSIYLGASTGQYSQSDIDNFLAQGVFKTDTEYERATNNVTWAQGRADNRASTEANLASSTYTFSAADNQALNDWVGDSGIERTQNLNAAYMAQDIYPFVNRTGRLPSNLANLMSAQLGSSDPNTRAFAMDSLSSMQQIDRNIVQNSSAFSADQKREVAAATALRGMVTEGQFQEWLDLRNDPNAQPLLEQRSKEAKDLFAEYSTDELLDGWDASVFAAQPAAPFDPVAETQFNAEFRTAFDYGYSLNGDEEQALAIATEMMQGKWQPSAVGSPDGTPRISKLPPSLYYPTVGDSHQWIDFNIRAEAGLGADAVFRLVPDAQTQKEGDDSVAGKSAAGPSYNVVVQQENGSWRALMGDNSMPLRYRAEISEQQNALNEARVEEANLTARIKVLDQQLATQVITEDDDPIAVERAKLWEQRKAIRENTKVVTGSDTPYEEITPIDQQLVENRKRQNELRNQITAARAPRSTVAVNPAWQEELDMLQEEERALDKKARGQ